MAAAEAQLRVRTPEEVRDIITRYVAALQKRVRVHKVISFGSYARGIPRRESDITGVVVDDGENEDKQAQEKTIAGVVSD